VLASAQMPGASHSQHPGESCDLAVPVLHPLPAKNVTLLSESQSSSPPRPPTRLPPSACAAYARRILQLF
jgi:hypothetical protein